MFIYISDKLISILAILFLSPLLLVVSVVIYYNMGSPIIYKQKRVGLNSREFTIYKFRSMKQSTSSKVLQAHEEEKRITRLGHILRKSNLDELPQLLNILNGDMSFVGPRPHEKSQDRLFSQTIENYSLRYKVKPGLTGLAQVNQFSGPIKNNHMLNKRVEHDIFWVKNKGIYLYYKIIFNTFLLLIKNVFLRKY